jgi:predicted Rdx family selenoprotein
VKANTDQAEPLRQHWALGHIGWLTQEVMERVVDDGATLLMGKGGGGLFYITVYRVCDQNDPGDTTAWKQQHNIQYEDKTARVGKRDPHKQTFVNLEYFVHELRNKEHDVAIFINANQNDRRCVRPQGHAQHFQSKMGST